jgi:antitoxin CcdA
MDNLRDVRHPVNLSVRNELLIAAREARINLSALLDRALEEELAQLKRVEWRLQNATSIAAYNRHVADCGAFFKSA